jgi:glucose-6-phosphate 1-epimerase
MSATLDSLRKWEQPGAVKIEEGPGGLLRVAIATSLAQAHIYLHGAHVTHYQPAGHSPVIFTSEESFYAHDKAIRGGVPVIFPWFGAFPGRADLPQHGFVRSAEWELEAVEKWSDETVQLVFRIAATDATRKLWPHDFVLRHRVTVGRKLEMRLEVENWGSDAFSYEEALHTYLCVRDVRQISVSGLDGAEYYDKTDNFARKTQSGLVTLAKETDSLYVNITSTCVVDDAAGARRLLVEKDGSGSTIVWNPWAEKAAGLKDFGNDEWPKMVCVESANAAENAVKLEPGASHILHAAISVER